MESRSLAVIILQRTSSSDFENHPAPPRLLLTPGLEGTGELLAPLVRALGDAIETKVLRYPADAPLSYAELLPRVRAELLQDEPFVLLGESFSGPLAIMLAA